MLHLEEYSLILHLFYDINQVILNKKSLFPKFQLIPILNLQVMHDYVVFHCSIDYSIELINCC